MYCGLMVSRNSLPTNMPRRLMSTSSWCAMRRPSWIRKLLSRLGASISSFQLAARVVQRRQHVVDRAGADVHEQPLVVAMQDPLHCLARVLDQPLHRRAGDRAEADRVLVQRQRLHVLDALIVGFARLLAQCRASFAPWRRWPWRAL
jgi:hypothetical protein